MSRDNMIRIQIEAGCPSGRSEHDEIGFGIKLVWSKCITH